MPREVGPLVPVREDLDPCLQSPNYPAHSWMGGQGQPRGGWGRGEADQTTKEKEFESMTRAGPLLSLSWHTMVYTIMYSKYQPFSNCVLLVITVLLVFCETFRSVLHKRLLCSKKFELKNGPLTGGLFQA